MENRIVFFAFRDNEMCFNHVMLNALDIVEKGGVAKIIFEGEAVRLPSILAAKNHPLYRKCLEKNIFTGICEACSKQMRMLMANSALSIPLIGEMNGHPAMEPYLSEGYEIVTL